MSRDRGDARNHDVGLIADYADRSLPLATAALPDEYFYSSLSLCVIDAVWLLGVRYAGVQRVVARYCHHAGVPMMRADRASLPLPSQQEPLAALCARLERVSPEEAGAKIFENRQRTSSRSGVLKAEAVHRFACTLRSHGVEYLQDVAPTAGDADLEADIRGIPGQGSGISLYYFWMLAGADDFVKPDRMIRRFVGSVIGHPVSPGEAQGLLREAAQRLQILHPHLTARLLDYEIWRYERARGRDSTSTPTCRSNGPAGSRCSPPGR